jgi:hypothetical protein
MKMNVLKKLTILEDEIDIIREASKIANILNKLQVGTHAIVDLNDHDETYISIAGRLHSIEEVKAMVNKIQSSKDRL